MKNKYDLQKVVKIVNWLIFERIVNTRRELADLLGYTESSFSQILNGKVPISDRFIKKLLNFNSQLNPDWFSSNNAEMLKSAKNPFSQMTTEEMAEIEIKGFNAELVAAYVNGEIYPAKVHDRIVAEKDKRIEELQQEVWELRKKLEGISK